MARRSPLLTTELIHFIEQQPMFFVATAAAQRQVDLFSNELDSLPTHIFKSS